LGIDSTMLYEALSRGLQTGFFSVRKSSFKNHNGYFGYPFNQKAKGLSWTSECNYDEVKRILNYLLKTSPKKYQNDMRDYILNLSYYDTDNIKFSKYLNRIINK
ncbi:hypothetical protein OAM09_05140, partial [Candidatus Pelagibacter sp.]|nr:hypothetical protein [Candidatus Pelagibacter sp.]